MIVIASPPRSGSTLLRNILAQHSMLYSPPELYLLPFNSMAERQKKLEGRPWLLKGLIQTFVELHQCSYEEASEFVDQLVDQEIEIDNIYHMIESEIGDKILVDKSPMNSGEVTNLGLLTKLFDHAILIHLHRHPCSAIQSHMRQVKQKYIKNNNCSEPDEEILAGMQKNAENIWLNCHTNVLHAHQNFPELGYFRICYESLIQDPRSILTRLCDYLEIPFEEALLSPYKNTDNLKQIKSSDKHFPLGDPGFYKHNDIDPTLADVWKTVKLYKPLEKATMLIAEYFDYELPSHISTHSPL